MNKNIKLKNHNNKLLNISKVFTIIFLLFLSFLLTNSKAQAADCSVSWDTSTRGCKTNCMKDGLYCIWDDGKSWASGGTNSCVVESTTPCPSDPSNGSYSFSCSINSCVLSCNSGYTKCGSSCVENDPLPANCTSYNQCTDTCTSCINGYTLESGVCVGVSLKLANDSVASSGNIIQSSNPVFYINPLGNLGVGIDTPDAKLHVIGGVKMSNLDGSYRVPLADTELVPKKYVDDNFIASAGGGSGSFFAQGGNAFATTATLGTIDDYNLDFITASSTRMTIDSSGNVGIGTTNPSTKLHISNGTISLNDGGNSVYIGDSAGINDDLSDNRNVGVGYQALSSQMIGGHNTAIGYSSLNSSEFGIGNTASGYKSLFVNISGRENTANGYRALYDSNSSYNTAIGSYALYSNTTGNYNTAIGSYAGRYIDGGGENETGNNSVFLGYDTRALADGQTNQIVIGNEAIGIGSNSVVLGNDSIETTALKGNVGIATSTPQAKLHVVSGGAKMSNNDGSYRIPLTDTELVPKKYVDDNFIDSASGGSSASFVGITSSSYNGNQSGYTTANAICSTEYTDSHICTVQEVLYTVNNGDSSSIPVTTAWMSGGAPGYTANANDCQGWKSSSHGDYGKVWIKLNTGDDGFGALSWCDVAAPFMCCK